MFRLKAVGVLNWLVLPETKPPAPKDQRPKSDSKVLSSTMKAWRRLAADDTVRVILTTHLCYWFTISGSQFTLMPILVRRTLHLLLATIQ